MMMDDVDDDDDDAEPVWSLSIVASQSIATPSPTTSQTAPYLISLQHHR
jgi:hypothetical protein